MPSSFQTNCWRLIVARHDSCRIVLPTNHCSECLWVSVRYNFRRTDVSHHAVRGMSIYEIYLGLSIDYFLLHTTYSDCRSVHSVDDNWGALRERSTKGEKPSFERAYP